MGQRIDAEGRFTNRRKQVARAITYGLNKAKWPTIVSLVLVVLFNLGISFLNEQNEMVYINTAEAATVPQEFTGLSVEQLEAKLDSLVWLDESNGHVMKEGEIFQTFDPPAGEKWWAICTKIGGKVNQECYSNGPRQTKIPTIQGAWKRLHGIEITEKDARDCAESNECSRRFFLDCSEQIEGCANLWTGFRKNATEGQIYLDLIREAKGIQI